MNSLITSKKRRQQPFESDQEHHSHSSDHHDDDDSHDDHHEQDSPSGHRCKRSRPIHRNHRMTWEERLQQLKEYKAKHGDLLIPIRFKGNPSLGKFVHNTREQYKLYQKPPAAFTNGKAKRCSLTAERVQQLEELGFVWSTERSKHQKEDWEARLQQLKDYKAKHGDCLVPHGYPEDPSFAEWVHRQRTTHAHMVKEEGSAHQARGRHHNPLVEQRMRQLEDMGFHFTVHADKWMEHWRELKMYRDIHGHCQVPTHCQQNPKLGRWVHTQRHQRRLQLKGKKSCMTDERVKMLDCLGFSWEVRPHKDDKEEDLSPLDPSNYGEVHAGVMGEQCHQVGMMGDPLVSVGSDEFHAGAHSVGGSVSSSDMANVQPQDLECNVHAQQDGNDYFGVQGGCLTMV